jgi:hypothetical protein
VEDQETGYDDDLRGLEKTRRKSSRDEKREPRFDVGFVMVVRWSRDDVARHSAFQLAMFSN